MRARSLFFAALAVVPVGLSLGASPASADPPKEGTFKSMSVRTLGCDTDGGKVTCTTGVKYLGEILGRSFTNDFAESARRCAGTKPGTYTFRFLYEYNDGQMVILKEEKLSPCMQAFAKEAMGRYLANWHTLQPMDPLVDVRSSYEATVVLK